MKRWSGRVVTLARTEWKQRILASGGWPCCRCGRPLRPGDPFQVDHWPIPRELGGTDTAPAHPRCNMAAGGRRGAEITNARREPEATRRIETRPTPW